MYYYLKCLSLLILYHYKTGITALMMAAQGGHTDTVKALIEAGADVNVTCKKVILECDVYLCSPHFTFMFHCLGFNQGVSCVHVHSPTIGSV